MNWLQSFNVIPPSLNMSQYLVIWKSTRCSTHYKSLGGGKRCEFLKPCLTKCVIIQVLTYTVPALVSICHANSLLVAWRKWGPPLSLETNKWQHTFQCVCVCVSQTVWPFGYPHPHYNSPQTVILLDSFPTVHYSALLWSEVKWQLWNQQKALN